jgi:hypothetical protein
MARKRSGRSFKAEMENPKNAIGRMKVPIGLYPNVAHRDMPRLCTKCTYLRRVQLAEQSSSDLRLPRCDRSAYHRFASRPGHRSTFRAIPRSPYKCLHGNHHGIQAAWRSDRRPFRKGRLGGVTRFIDPAGLRGCAAEHRSPTSPNPRAIARFKTTKRFEVRHPDQRCSMRRAGLQAA